MRPTGRLFHRSRTASFQSDGCPFSQVRACVSVSAVPTISASHSTPIDSLTTRRRCRSSSTRNTGKNMSQFFLPRRREGREYRGSAEAGLCLHSNNSGARLVTDLAQISFADLPGVCRYRSLRFSALDDRRELLEPWEERRAQRVLHGSVAATQVASARKLRS